MLSNIDNKIGISVYSHLYSKCIKDNELKPQNSKEFEVEAELTIHALEQGFKVGEFECLYKGL